MEETGADHIRSACSDGRTNSRRQALSTCGGGEGTPMGNFPGWLAPSDAETDWGQESRAAERKRFSTREARQARSRAGMPRPIGMSGQKEAMNEGSNVKFSEQEALLYHSEGRPGKIEIIASKPMATQRDLSLAYSPGVA